MTCPMGAPTSTGLTEKREDDDSPRRLLIPRSGVEGAPSAELLEDVIGRLLQGLEERQQAALEAHTNRLLAAVRAAHAIDGGCRGGAREGAQARAARPPRVADGPVDSPGPCGDVGTEGQGAMWMSGECEGQLPDVAGGFASPDVDVAATAENPSSDSLDEAMTPEEGMDWQWQWQSSAGPFKPYDPSSNLRIEAAYRRGESLIRLKSGKDGKVPMEVFFVDMIQHDPESTRVRSIRRVGTPLTAWQQAKRRASATWRGLCAGQKAFESWVEYKARQSALSDDYLNGLGQSSDQDMTLCATHSTQLGHLHKLRKQNVYAVGPPTSWRSYTVCSRLVQSRFFLVVTSIVLLLQAWWIWHSTDQNFGLPLYEQDTWSLIWEHFFCVYFTLEFAIHVLALRRRASWYRDPWLLLDFTCLVSSVVDVLVLPLLTMLSYMDSIPEFSGDALRLIRLLKLVRISKIFGHSKEFNIIIKGMLSGMTSAAYILALLAAVVFTFAVMMRVQSDVDILRPHFGTVPQAMITLLSRGLFLDGVSIVINDLFETRLFVPSMLFGCFVYISFFGLLSMLIGAFCSVADKVHSEEHDAKEMRELYSKLEDIAECYTDGGGDQPLTITDEKFKTFMKNPDVHVILIESKVDIAGVVNFATALFKTRTTHRLEFVELLGLIVRLRMGNPPLSSDIAVLQGFLMQSFDRLERMVACSIGGTSSNCGVSWE